MKQVLRLDWVTSCVAFVAACSCGNSNHGIAGGANPEQASTGGGTGAMGTSTSTSGASTGAGGATGTGGALGIAGSTVAIDSGVTQEGGVTNPAPTGPVAFPLKVSANGRYLVDQKGVPFRIHADSAWSLISNLTAPEIDTYLADRKSRGFNTILVSSIEHHFAVQAPRNRAGDYPFTAHATGKYDFSMPNEPYFAFADAAIDKMAASGMLVLLDIMYLGYDGGDEGWWTELTNSTNTQAKSYAYGQFNGKRWKDKGNICWIFSGDYTPPAGSEGETRLLQIYKGVRDAGATQIVGAHVFEALSSDWKAFTPFLQVNGIYRSTTEIAPAGRNAYQLTPAKPVFLFEAGYEAEGWSPGDPSSIRSYEWWAQLSGIAGVLYGHRDIWEFNTDSWSSGYPFSSQRWQLSLDTPGSRAMKAMANLLSSLPWYDLVPSGLAGMKTLITSNNGAPNESDYIAAAATPNGKALLAYLPPAGDANRSVTVDMTAMSAPATARWWDPANAAFKPVADGTVVNTGTHAFTAPGNNSAGAHDWILVLTAP